MKKPVCQFETIEDHFNFGRYNGLTLADVLEINPSYIEWCVKKCDGVYFLIENNAITQIKIAYPEFPLSEEFINKCQQRIDDYYDDYNEMCDKFNSAQEDNYYENSYGRYAGSYVQDEMGYSDDNIDTIFDGAPDAYWNID